MADAGLPGPAVSCPAHASVFRPRRGARLTSQGHPRTVFRRALQNGNLVAAELSVREVGRVDLGEALELTALIARHDRERSRRVAARWLQRWLEEMPGPTIDDAALAAGALAALGGTRHLEALAALRSILRRPAARSGRPAAAR